MNPLALIKKVASVVQDPVSGNTSSTRVGAVGFATAAISYALADSTPDPWILGILVAGAVLSWLLRVPSNGKGGE